MNDKPRKYIDGKQDTMTPEECVDMLIKIADNIGVLGMLRSKLIQDQQPEKGHWLDDGDPCAWTCNVCGYRTARHNNTPFCPNCGADMRKDGEQN